MQGLSSKGRQFFVREGRKGGLKRARQLSPLQRSTIAMKGAHARWEKKGIHKTPMSSIRITNPQLSDMVYLEELLSHGTLDEWRELYLEIADRPFGLVAKSLERVLEVAKIYGVTPLWQGLLNSLRGSFP